MNDFSDQIEYFVGLAAGAMTDDAYWRFFGYQSTPKRGKWFESFADKSDIEKERFIFKEIALIAIIDIIESIKILDIEEQQKLFLLLGIVVVLRNIFFEAKLFSNNSEYMDYLRAGIPAYMNDGFLHSFKSRSNAFLGSKNSLSLIPGALIFQSSINISNSSKDDGILLNRKVVAENFHAAKTKNTSNHSYPNKPLTEKEFCLYANFVEEIYMR